MASTIDNSQTTSKLSSGLQGIPDDFRDGKVTALRILYESYLEMEIRGVKFLSVREFLQTIRTLILNLERSDTS